MSGANSARTERGYLVRFLLAITLLLVANSIADRILSGVLLPFFVTNEPTSFVLYELALDLYFLGYLVVFLLVFYFMGLKSHIVLNRDWLALLEYLFLGGLLGDFFGLLTTIGINSVFYGTTSGLGLYQPIIGLLSLVLGFIRDGGEYALEAFAAVIVGIMLRPQPLGESATPALESGTAVEPAQGS